MLFLFKRGSNVCRVETSYDDATKQYMLIIHRDPNDAQIEKFKDPISFGHRLEKLRDDLAHEGWEQEDRPRD